MYLEFTQPFYLFGLLLTGLLILFWRRSLVDLSRRQRLFSLIVRMAVLILLVLALAGGMLRLETKNKTVVFVRDRSLSIDEAADRKSLEFIEAALKGLDRSDKTSWIQLEFARSPRMLDDSNSSRGTSNLSKEDPDISNKSSNESKERQNLSKEDQKSLDRKNSSANGPSVTLINSKHSDELVDSTDSDWRNGTDLSRALELASAELSSQRVGSIVVLSDGNETSGDARTTAKTLGVPVSTVLLPSRETPEVQLAELIVPSEVRRGEPFRLEAIVHSNRECPCTISIYRDDYKILEDEKRLVRGENRFVFRQAVESGRQAIYTVLVKSESDTLIDNNRLSNIVFIGGRPRVLFIDDDAKSVRSFISTLKRQDLEVELRPSNGLPRTLEALGNYDIIFLSNVSATSLTRRQMDLLTFYVRDLGGGLIISGGDQSFGLGGYYKTPLDELLPVRSRFEKEKEKPSLALALVIDRSGSMGGEKMEMAKDAAKGALELLSGRDYISVVAFDHLVHEVVPIQMASSASSISGAIGTIEAAGGTNIYPGLESAFHQLDKVTAKLKHVILLTDGYSEPKDYESLVREMTGRRITLSTIGVGDADNDLLTRLAKAGKGRHYVCENSGSIPQIFARETTIASKSAIAEEPFVPVRTSPSKYLTGIDLESAPPLLGYVKTRSKPTARTVLTTEKGEPLLAEWRYGLGITVAFTSDVKNRWSAEWLSWPDSGVLWAQIVRYAMRRTESGGSRVLLQQKAGRAELVFDVLNEQDAFVNDGTGTLTVISPDLEKSEYKLVQTAPGRYEASVDLSRQGGYQFQWTLVSDGKTVVSQSRGLMTGYSEELRIADSNRDLMQQLAESTGGTFEPQPGFVFKSDGRVAFRSLPLWPWLLTVALLLSVLDLLLRRVELFSKIKLVHEKPEVIQREGKNESDSKM